MYKSPKFFFIFYIIFTGCTDEVEDDESQASNYSFEIIHEDTGITLDENGYYHLTIDRNNWQTLYRVRGIAYKDENPAAFIKFHWESNLYWVLGDTLGYYIHRGLTDDLEWVSYDTTYVTGFSGMMVPTSNTTSVSGADGEVSNMIAPVRIMIGDTLILDYHFFDWIYESDTYSGQIKFVLD